MKKGNKTTSLAKSRYSSHVPPSRYEAAALPGLKPSDILSQQAVEPSKAITPPVIEPPKAITPPVIEPEVIAPQFIESPSTWKPSHKFNTEEHVIETVSYTQKSKYLSKSSAVPKGRPPTATLRQNKCVCKNSICNGEPHPEFDRLNKCVRIHKKSKKDSKTVACILIKGNSSDCDSFAQSYNSKMSSCKRFYEDVEEKLIIDEPCDRAFRMLSFNFDTFFGEDITPNEVKKSLKSSKSYFSLINKVLGNVMRKFCSTEYCGTSEYRAICEEFDKVNKDENNQSIQASPFFSFGWDITGQPCFTAASRNIESSRICSEMIQYLKFPLISRDLFDMGFMPRIIELLEDRSQSIVLQVMIPDGRWSTKKGLSGAIRYSDISITLTARGKATKEEALTDNLVQAARRELMEEVGLDLVEDSFTCTAEWGRSKLFEVDINKMITSV